jgi:Domain of unknown function (DUF4349)
MSDVAAERIGQLVDGRPAASVDEALLVETLSALREARPEPSGELRERVRGLKREQRRPRFAFSFSWRRGALMLAPACVALALGGALVAGVLSSGRDVAEPSADRAVQREVPSWSERTHAGATTSATALSGAAGARSVFAPSTASSLPPSSARLQGYDAYLSLRVRGVDRLSDVTKQAVRIARSLGGYPAYVDVDTARQGDAALRLRVPVGRVQEAVLRLSRLGTIVTQRYSVTDLQRQSNDQLRRIAELEGRIGRLRLTLAGGKLTPERRARLQLELDRLQAQRRAGRSQHAATLRRGRLATVTLSLTTRSAAVPAKPHQSGRIGGALADAGSVLAHELAWALYLLVVLAPIAALGALVVLALRFLRRREERFALEA